MGRWQYSRWTVERDVLIVQARSYTVHCWSELARDEDLQGFDEFQLLMLHLHHRTHLHPRLHLLRPASPAHAAYRAGV